MKRLFFLLLLLFVTPITSFAAVTPNRTTPVGNYHCYSSYCNFRAVYHLTPTPYNKPLVSPIYYTQTPVYYSRHYIQRPVYRYYDTYSYYISRFYN